MNITKEDFKSITESIWFDDDYYRDRVLSALNDSFDKFVSNKLKTHVDLNDVSKCYRWGGNHVETVRRCNNCGATKEIQK